MESTYTLNIVHTNTNMHINVTTTVYNVILKIQLERISNF